jgi:hypothetical protein
MAYKVKAEIGNMPIMQPENSKHTIAAPNKTVR